MQPAACWPTAATKLHRRCSRSPRQARRCIPNSRTSWRTSQGVNIDLRSDGTLLFPAPGHPVEKITGASPLSRPVAELEPGLNASGRTAVFLHERSVCPRALTQAALKAAKHRSVDVASGSTVVSVDVSGGRASGVTTHKSAYHAGAIVNCAGAWAGQIGPLELPCRPVKGQMVCFAMSRRDILRHVVRSPEIYLIPRSDGRLLAGATLEEAGFDKRTVPETIQRLRREAIVMLPALEQARVLEDWAGLRPGTPDSLPILGETRVSGYFVATGHFRDGILLAPGHGAHHGTGCDWARRGLRSCTIFRREVCETRGAQGFVGLLAPHWDVDVLKRLAGRVLRPSARLY